MRDYTKDLLPVPVPTLFAREENPIATVAESFPLEAASVMRGMIRARVRESRLDALRSVSKDQADIACAWLQNRNPGEKNIAVATGGDTCERGCLFPRGERVRMRTIVSIW